MRYLRCQHEFPVGMRFCGGCAAPACLNLSVLRRGEPAQNTFCGDHSSLLDMRAGTSLPRAWLGVAVEENDSGLTIDPAFCPRITPAHSRAVGRCEQRPRTR